MDESGKFFTVTADFYMGLLSKTGHFMELDVEKTNGTKRTLRGILGYSSKKGVFVINEDADGSREGIRSFNHYKIMRIKMNGKNYFPKRQV